jgi:DNA primase
MSSASPQAVAPAQDFARTVKDAVDIVKIIGDYVRLTKAGAQNYRGLCPFHKEKTPSFTVHATQGFFHCFGCHEGGDVFKFVQKIENVTFPEALRIVAQKAGVPLPKRGFSGPEEAKEARQRGLLLQMHDVAAQFFQQQLQTAEGSRAREYLASRELPAPALEKFAIGYAPDSFTALRDRLQGEYDEPLLRMSGLFGSKSKEEGGSGDLYDRFRKRITFPIRNEQGRVIAFTARALETNEKAGPKYLNSPETPLYSKGAVLFNLDLAKTTMRQYDFALLVEGQMDCIRAYVNGVPNVLATSGTAFTEIQARLLGRFTRRVVVNFDPDTAGANAAEKTIMLLMREGFEIKVMTLAGGLDPDRYIRERGAAEYVAQLKAAPRCTDYLIGWACRLFPPRTAENKVRAVSFLRPYAELLPSWILRNEFEADVAQRLGVEPGRLRKDWERATGSRHRSPNQEYRDPMSVSESKEPVGGPNAPRLLLRALLLDSGNPVRAAARELVLKQSNLVEGLSAAPLLMKLAGFDETPNIHEVECAEEERDALVRLLMDPALEPTVLSIENWAHELRLRQLERRRRELSAEIAAAERAGDNDALRALSEERMETELRFRELKTE